MPEEWRSVIGYEEHYEVSSLGAVRRTASGQGAVVGRVLRSAQNGHGYRMLRLWMNGRSRPRYVHHLVAEAFIGPRPPKHDIDHLDADLDNNAHHNLRYCTHAENQHGMALRGSLKGENNGQALLTENDVIKIRQLRAEGFTLAAIGVKVGVSFQHVGDILRGKRWGWLK